MRDCIFIDGVRYRKCMYIKECIENQFRGEVVEVQSVQPMYVKDVPDRIGIGFLMPNTKFRPGMKIRIDVVDSE